MPLETISRCTKLLKYLTSSSVTFATADNSIAATGIGTAFPTAGDKFIVSGAAQSGNNKTFTVVSATANKVIVAETVTAETAGATVKCNGTWIGDWMDATQYSRICGVVNTSGAGAYFVDHSNDKSTYHSSTATITGGTSIGIDVPNYAHWVRLRVKTTDVDQTSMAVSINGVI